MTKFEHLKTEWASAFVDMSQSAGFQRLVKCDIEQEHYKAILREIYLLARETPGLHAFAITYFRGVQRQMVGTFLKHSMAEMGFDQLAERDLKNLGEDTTYLCVRRPLPPTTALIAIAYYLIQRRSPVAFLGYIFHLECMLLTSGKTYMAALETIGVPKDAMTFIQEKCLSDHSQMKYLEQYIDLFVVSEDDEEEFIYGTQLCARLYGQMIQDAIESVDKRISHVTYDANEIDANYRKDSSEIKAKLRQLVFERSPTNSPFSD